MNPDVARETLERLATVTNANPDLRIGPSVQHCGGYEIGGVRIMVTRRPMWLQRFMARWFFGWRWEDGSP